MLREFFTFIFIEHFDAEVIPDGIIQKFGFVIAVYAILFLISIIVSNIPLIRMYGESEELNSIMRIIVGSLLAVTILSASRMISRVFMRS